MDAVALVKKYIYVPMYWPKEEQRFVVQAFAEVGYDTACVCTADSVGEAADLLAQGSILVVYTLGEFGSSKELLEVLTCLEERGVLLQSLREPWANESIRDYAIAVEKIRRTMNSVLK